MQKLESLINILNKSFYREIITSDAHFDKAAFSLTYGKQFPKEEISLFSEQIEATKKAKNKLPSWRDNECLFTKRAFEQSTHEEVARYKADEFKGKTLLSLCGGLGVDDWAFSKVFDKVTGVDSDGFLNEMVRYNAIKLGVKNYQRIDDDVNAFLEKNDQKFDVVYIDPDRREEEKRRFNIEDYQPNVFDIKEKVFEFTETLLIKVSPMAEISEIKKLGNIFSIHAISFQHELKEILINIQKGYEGEICMEASDFTNDLGWKKISAKEKTNEGNHHPIHAFLEQMDYLAIPSPSVTKIAMMERLSKEIGYFSGDRKCHLLSGSRPAFSSLHREFKVIKKEVFQKSVFTQYLRENKIQNANIMVKNYRLKPEEIRKQFKLKDGGEDSFIFFQIQKTAYFAHVQLIKNENVS